jgi:acetyl-CoA carboxylase alpha subunit
MKTIRTQNLFTLAVSFAACMVLAIGLSGRALASSCGDSLSAMAEGVAASIQSQSSLMQQDSESSKDNAEHASIVGLWYVRFMVGDQTIQEAYQIWNAGGTDSQPKC